jgi:hypothetical protein
MPWDVKTQILFVTSTDGLYIQPALGVFLGGIFYRLESRSLTLLICLPKMLLQEWPFRYSSAHCLAQPLNALVFAADGVLQGSRISPRVWHCRRRPWAPLSC